MIQMRSTFCLVLAFLMLFTFMTNSAFANDTKDQSAVVTSHDPKSRMSEVKKASKKSGSGWLWGILGIAVVAGGIAILAGGGSDSGGGDDPGTPTTTGDYDFSW